MTSSVKWTIEPYQVADHDLLVDIWLRSVKQTHHFLTQNDIMFYHKIVSEQALCACPIWQLNDQQKVPAGFIGVDQHKIEMLFVDPDKHGLGLGTLLVQFALKQCQANRVDVNEQNAQAVHFYQKFGFKLAGCSPVDNTGRPFPILHLSRDH